MSDREALRAELAEEISEALYAAHCYQSVDCAIAATDAVMPIVEQLQADNEALRLVVAKVTALADGWEWLRRLTLDERTVQDQYTAGRANAYAQAAYMTREVLAEVTPQPAPVPTPESSQP